jgi:hypothetical protein
LLLVAAILGDGLEKVNYFVFLFVDSGTPVGTSDYYSLRASLRDRIGEFLDTSTYASTEFRSVFGS